MNYELMNKLLKGAQKQDGGLTDENSSGMYHYLTGLDSFKTKQLVIGVENWVWIYAVLGNNTPYLTI